MVSEIVIATTPDPLAITLAFVPPVKPRFLEGCKVCVHLKKKYNELKPRSPGRRIVNRMLRQHWLNYHQPKDGKFVYGSSTSTATPQN